MSGLQHSAGDPLAGDGPPGASTRRRYRLGELAEHVDGKVIGDAAAAEVEISGVATLHQAEPTDLSLFTNARYRSRFKASRAAAVLVGTDVAEGPMPLLQVEQPYWAWARLVERFHPTPVPVPGVSPQASVDPSAHLGVDVSVAPFAVIEAGATLEDRVALGPHAVVGAGSHVGEGSQLHAGAVLYPGVVVGARCQIHSGVVLGADGFGFVTVDGQHHKIPQVGRVVIGDEVEIGANTTIDRGALEDTSIGEGCKIDNQVMLGHGVQIGRGSMLAGQVGIAGSARIGEYTLWGGKAAALGHIEVADRTAIVAGTGIFNSVRQSGMISGLPAKPHAVWLRETAAIRRLPEMRRQVAELTEKVAELQRVLGVAGAEEGAADSSTDDGAAD